MPKRSAGCAQPRVGKRARTDEPGRGTLAPLLRGRVPLPEGPVALVEEQDVPAGLVGEEQVHAAVTVRVDGRDRQRMRAGISRLAVDEVEAGLRRDIHKLPVAEVSVHGGKGAHESRRRRVGGSRDLGHERVPESRSRGPSRA